MSFRNLGLLAFAVLFASTSLSSLALAQPVTDTEIETFLGLDLGTLDTLSADTPGGGFATEGSALQTSFFVSAGDVVTVDLNFVTAEITPEPDFNDFAFVSFIVDGLITAVADTNTLGFSPVDPPINDVLGEQTGLFTFTHVVDNTGPITLAVGVLDEGDTVVDSAVIIDNIQIDTLAGGQFFDFESGTFAGFETIGVANIVGATIPVAPIQGRFSAALSTGLPLPSVPEPASIALLGMAAAGLTTRRRRR